MAKKVTTKVAADAASVQEALWRVQAELKAIPKAKTASGKKFSYKYADLPGVLEVVQPLLTKHKLSWSQPMDVCQDRIMLRTILCHWPSQTSIVSDYPLSEKHLTEDPQDGGTAITYARRYSLSAIVGVVADEDNDALNHRKDQPSVRPDSQSRPAVRPGPGSGTAPVPPSRQPVQRPTGTPPSRPGQ